MKEFEGHTSTRQVLTEKAPFLVEILNTPMSNVWWYQEYIGECLFVRNATSEDIEELLQIDVKYKFEKSDPDDYYIVMGNVKRSTVYQKGIILKVDCERV